MAKPRLLFLSQCLPFPANSGVRIRTYHTLRALADEFDVLALCYYRKAGHSSQAMVDLALAELRRFCRAEAFPIPQEHSKSRLVADHLRSLVARRVYTYFAYASAEYISATERAIREYQPKVVHLDSLDLSSLLDLIPPSIPVSICHHNIESRLLEVRATQESPLRASYLRIQSSLMRKEEAVMAPKVKVNFTVSEPDRAELLRIAPTANVVVAPNGVDTALRLPVVSAGKSLIFVGGASWFPNRDALEYFGSDILPLIRKTVPGVTVHWIGQCTDQLRDQIERRFGITLVGYADDLTRYLQDSALFIVPLRVGGGTRLKILDAWAWQLPVVSTSVGCEGLDARNGQNIVIADSPAEFSDAVVKLLTEKELREKIAREGRVTAMQKYDWTYIGKIIRGAVTLNSVVSKLSAES